MPKIPSNRAGVCEACGAIVPWGARVCEACAAAPSAQPPAPGGASGRYLYRAVPFHALTPKGKSEADLVKAATEQLQGVLNRLDLEGWEFVRVESVSASSAPGCLGMLTGARDLQTRLDMVVVRRERGPGG